MGLCYNIAFIFSFEYMYPEEACILAICEIISNKEETEYYDKYIVKVSKAKFFIEESINKEELYVDSSSQFFEKIKKQNTQIMYKDKNNLRNMKNTKIILYVSKGESFSVGDVISVEGKFEKGEISRNYKGFSYRNYLKTKKIYGIVNAENIVKIKHKIDSYSILGKIQYNLKSKIDYLYSTENASFLKGILLGDISTLDKDIKDNFRDSSISHILAISGLHVTYVVLGVNFLLEKIIKNKNIRNYILIFLLFIFLVLTGFSASCIRACIMSSMELISFNIKRKNNFYITFVLSFFIIIMINPFNIFNIGMWLSFAGTLGIVLFSKFLYRVLEIKLKVNLSRNKTINIKKDNKNKSIIDILKEQTNSSEKLYFKCSIRLIIKYIKEKIFKILLSIFLVSISAQILIFPIMIYSFNTFSLTFFISNILISVFIGPILILGYATVFTSFFFLPISKIIAIIETQLIYVVFDIARICANLPLSKIYVTTPNFIEIFIYYLFIVIVVYLLRMRKVYMIKILLSYRFLKKEICKILVNIKKEMNIKKLKYKLDNRKQVRKLEGVCKNKIISRLDNILKEIIIISLIILNLINFINFDSSLKIYFVDVGQGDCTVIITPKGKKIIIDGGEGNSDKYDAGKNIVLPYLLDRKINKIDYLIVSHGDSDHIGGLFAILENIKVNKIFIGIQPEICNQLNDLIQIANQKKIEIIVLQEGMEVEIEKGLKLEVIFPNPKKMINENELNNNSLVFKLKYNNFSMLFTGDIEEIAENEILKSNNDLTCVVLKVGHHGSKTSSTEDFIKAVKPKIALIGVGKKNNFGHPSEDVLERFKSLGTKVYRTDLMGEIMIKVDRKSNLKIMTKIKRN